jgi:hypothetical protein
MTRRRVWTRIGLGLVWGVVMLVLFAALLFAGMVAGGYVGFVLLPRYNGGHDVQAALAAGAVVGVVLAVTVCHRARGWVQRLRLRLMRGHGVSAVATVVWGDELYTPGTKGPGSIVYTVYFAWSDPSGQQLRERQYRFIGKALRAFETRLAVGARVPIRYPAARPHRFIVDIPYAPTMADQFI